MNDLKRTTDLWDANAKDWSSGIRDGLDVINDQFGLPFFLSQLSGLEGKTILDAGCGEGRSTRALVQTGAQLVGVDISRPMLAMAKAEEARHPRGIRYLEASCLTLEPIESNSIDVVTCYMSLMDMPDMPGAMLEFARVLKPGGRIFIMVRHPCFFTPGFSIYSSKAGERTGVTVSGYFKNEAYTDKFSFPGRPQAQFKAIRFPYTIGRYTESLRKAGFALCDLQEPTPTDALCATHPRLEFWRIHAGIFLFLQGQLAAV